jgi:hypothetical protein
MVSADRKARISINPWNIGEVPRENELGLVKEPWKKLAMRKRRPVRMTPGIFLQIGSF